MRSSSTQLQSHIRIDRQNVDVLTAKERLSDDVALRLVRIPEGNFMMGSPNDEGDRRSEEGPQHLVKLQEFWIGKYPVTQAEWAVVAGFPKIDRDLNPAPSNFKGDRLPVEQISWYEAKEFCDRLSAYTKRQYRLPTEAEWEYACRAGTTTPFHFGETITTELANYQGTDDENLGWSGSYGKGPKGEYRKKITPVDHFKIANMYGLCDMHGNVWEWCQDHWHDNYDDAPTDGSAWIEGGDRDFRVYRGGSWILFLRFCRSAYRGFNAPGNQINNLGFRVVLAPR